MISAKQIRDAFDAATDEFSASTDLLELVSGQAQPRGVQEFIRNVFRTHYLSSHIVALCFAALPSTAASLLKENLLEEMGHSENEPPHSALLLELAQGIGFSAAEIEDLIADSCRQLAIFCATRVPFPTLRELCLSILLETMSFEHMLSRCSRKISDALFNHYALSKESLQWFELHSEVDIRHAEEGLAVIQDYVDFHQFSDSSFARILQLTMGGNAFARHYFPPESRSGGDHRSPTGAGNIDALTIYQLRIPFRQSFSHAQHSRDESDAVIIRIRGSDGVVGYGEALPRPYVTGETTTSMISHIRDRLAPQIFSRPFTPGWDTFDYLESVWPDWTHSTDKSSDVIAWNAAFCAVELALLDWNLKRLNTSLANFLLPVRYDVIYSGVIPSDSPQEAAALAGRMIKLGIRQIKIKVGTDDDIARLEAVRKSVGDEVELRADANGAWSAAEAVAQLKRLELFKLQTIEQPVAANDIRGLKRVREETGIPVMVDESLVTVDQARQLIEAHACDYFNIRLSKCGGITGSLAIAKLAQIAGIKTQLGAQVGETGILSAAGRTFAAYLPQLLFTEGSFGTWLLSEDITFENVTFGYGGSAPLLQTRGLGVTVNEETLERLSIAKIDLHR